jgi:putative DNA primase/helicase
MSKPQLIIKQGNIPELVNSAEEYIATRRTMYVHHDHLVRIGEIGNPPRVAPVEINEYAVAETLDQYIEWWRYSDKDTKTRADCPMKVARTLIARQGKWRLPKLLMVTAAPSLRPNGTIIDQPGYDAETGVFYHPNGVDFPAIPQNPIKDDARHALDDLIDLVSEVPFVEHEEYGQINRSVFLAAFLTAVGRSALPFVPFFAFDASTPGSGKSMLNDTISYAATGRPASVLSQGQDDEETEKRLVAALIQGDGIIVVDNCIRSVQGALLCQMATSPSLFVRILGQSKNVEIPNTATVLLNGNNLTISGDLVRRAPCCTINHNVERPESKVFKTVRPDFRIAADRPRYLVAALTVLRAFYVAGRPQQCTETEGFEAWSRLVRDALVWLGEPDPWLVMAETRQDDPERAKRLAVLEQWFIALGDDKKKVNDLIQRATKTTGDYRYQDVRFANEAFHDALMRVAGSDDGKINNAKLGRWIARNKHRITDGFQILPCGNKDGYPYYCVTKDEQVG